MFRFHCDGIMRESGEPIAIEVEASGTEAAAAKANACGMLVNDVVFLDAPRPTPPPVIVTRAPRVQTIERTGKKWKGQQLAGCLTSVIALVVMISAAPETASDDKYVSVFAGLAFFAGLCIWLHGRFGAWWHHG